MTTTVAADAASMGCVKRVEVGMAYILFAPVDVKPKPSPECLLRNQAAFVRLALVAPALQVGVEMRGIAGLDQLHRHLDFLWQRAQLQDGVVVAGGIPDRGVAVLGRQHLAPPAPAGVRR